MDTVTSNINAGLIADIVCLVIIAIFAIINGKKGLMGQIFKVACTVGALLLAYFFSEPLTAFVTDTFKLDALLSEKIHGLFDKGGAYLNEVTPENLQAVLAELKLPDFITELALNSINTGAFANIGDYLSNLLAHYIILLLAFVILVIVSKILLTLVSKVLKKIVELPGLKDIDRFLGFLWGIAKAAIIIFALMFIIELVPGDSLIEVKKAIDASIVASFLQEYNAVTYAISWIATKLNFSL